MQHADRDEFVGGQLALLPESIDDRMLEQREYAQGIYSGARLRNADPERYRSVCALLAEGALSQRQISRLAGISRNLVAAIARGSDIEPHKHRIAQQARNLAGLCLERAEEMVQAGDKLSLRDLAIMAGVAIDKSLLLAGEATNVLEVRRTDPVAALDAAMASLSEEERARLRAMGLAPGSSAAKGAGRGDDGDDGGIEDGEWAPSAGSAGDAAPDGEFD